MPRKKPGMDLPNSAELMTVKSVFVYWRVAAVTARTIDNKKDIKIAGT